MTEKDIETLTEILTDNEFISAIDNGDGRKVVKLYFYNKLRRKEYDAVIKEINQDFYHYLHEGKDSLENHFEGDMEMYKKTPKRIRLLSKVKQTIKFIKSGLVFGIVE